MSTEDNKATVRRFTEEGMNQGNIAVFDELCAPNWVYHEPGSPDVRTLADYKRSITEARSAFPDFHTTIEDLIAEGDKVVMRSTWRGTNTGDFVTPMPLPATGKQVTVMESPSSALQEGRQSKSGAWGIVSACSNNSA